MNKANAIAQLIVQRLGIPALETELLAAIEAELAEVSA